MEEGYLSRVPGHVGYGELAEVEGESPTTELEPGRWLQGFEVGERGLGGPSIV